MFNIILTAGGLGLAGFDPAGAMVGIGLLGMGIHRRNIIVMIVTFMVGTVALGTGLSVILGPRVAGFDWRKLEPSHQHVAIGLFVGGLLLLAWGIHRLVHPPVLRTRTQKAGRRGTGPFQLALLGIIFALSSLISPPFLALVVIASSYDHLVQIVLAHTIWFLLNQSTLLIVTGVAMTGAGEDAIANFRRWWIHITPLRNRLVTSLALVLAGAFILESVWWKTTNTFLLA